MSHSTTPSTPAPPPPPKSPQPTIGQLVARISENVSNLVRGEIDLAKANAKLMASTMGLGVGLLVAAGVLALYGLGFLFTTIAHAIAVALPLWAGYLIVTVSIFVIVAILALVGKLKLDAAKTHTPDPKAGLNRDMEVVKDAVRQGLERGNQE